jgi:hypothetical protein
MGQQFVILTDKGLAKYKDTDNKFTEGKAYAVRRNIGHNMIEVACDRNLICPLCHGDYAEV